MSLFWFAVWSHGSSCQEVRAAGVLDSWQCFICSKEAEWWKSMLSSFLPFGRVQVLILGNIIHSWRIFPQKGKLILWKSESAFFNVPTIQASLPLNYFFFLNPGWWKKSSCNTWLYWTELDMFSPCSKNAGLHSFSLITHPHQTQAFNYSQTKLHAFPAFTHHRVIWICSWEFSCLGPTLFPYLPESEVLIIKNSVWGPSSWGCSLL